MISSQARWQARDLLLALAFAEKNAGTFDASFIFYLEIAFKRKKYFTEVEHQELIDVIDKWKMEEWANENGWAADENCLES